MSSFTRTQLEFWLSTIHIDCNRFLDIGGAQLEADKRFGSLKYKEKKVLDLPNPHQTNHPVDIALDLNEYIDINKMFEYIAPFGEFDVAFMGEVSEYFWNPVQAFKNINNLLKIGGILYFSTHFIYPVHSPLDDDSLRYTRNGIIKILNKTGFKIEEIRGRTWESLEPISLFRSQGMRPSKIYNLHGEIGNLIKCSKI